MSLEYREIGIAEGVCEIWSTKFLRKILDSADSRRKQAVRKELNTVWITKIPCVIFEQFKDTLVVIPLMSELMGYTSTPHNWKEYIFHRECS